MARISRQDLTQLVTRAVAPGVVVWAAIVGFGLLITGPLTGLSKSEESVNKTLASDRTPTWNTITMFWSHIGNTEYVIAVCILVSLILLWRTKDLLFSLVPVIAISLQATIFVLATLVIGRPRPKVSHLDPAPPTSSYPSGHVGASTALYLTFALLAQRIERTWLRVLTTVVCLLLPLLVTYARLYRGMHHVTDVSVGMLNGIVCALLAYAWYRHRARERDGAGARVRDAARSVTS
ncbi:phosphatase PAP2 family protein [Pedococcus sp. NPDC057267]|uniref:phosphatase PAP2 family protein n=1 Tax=Pedococcus sp. NPDC057267 TaxID=3346077 RepID=UPI00363CFD76